MTFIHQKTEEEKLKELADGLENFQKEKSEKEIYDLQFQNYIDGLKNALKYSESIIEHTFIEIEFLHKKIEHEKYSKSLLELNIEKAEASQKV